MKVHELIYNHSQEFQFANSSKSIINLNIQSQFGILNMKISTITLLFVVLVLQTHSTFNFGFDVNRANAVLNAGSCYLQPGFYQSAKNDVAVRYYNLPYGWRQYQDRIVIPSVLGQKGNFNLGVKAISGSDSVNQQFNVAVNGLSIKVSPASSSSSKNLVIGSNYRTDSLNDKQYSSLVSSISKGQYWVNDPSQFWVYGSNPGVRYFGNNQDEYKRSRSTFSTSGSSSSGNINNLGSLNDLIFGYEDSRQADTIRNNIIYSNTPSQVTITNGASSNLRQALNQQFTITSSLTEVNRLIEQLTSNVNSVTSSISKLQTSYNQYKQTSSSCNDKVLELSNTKLRAQTEINGLTDQVSTWKNQLADLTPALNSLIQRRSQLVRQRDQIQRTTPNAASINQIESQFNRCNSDIENTRNQFTRIQGTLQQNNNKISELEASASNAPQQIQLATDQLNVVRQTISDLQAKLSEARSQQKKLQSDIAGYNSAIRTSSSQIESIRNQNSRLTSQISSFQSNIDSQTLRCSELKTQSEQIRNSIATKQQDYQDLNNQISVQDDLISAKRSEVQKLQSSSSSLPSALAKLQSDLTNAEVAVSRQFFICNQANDNVARVDNEIKAAQLRLQTEKKFLNDAQTKLATLTTQKRTIDDLVAKLQSSVSTSTTTTGSFTGGSSTGNVFGSTGTVYGVNIGGNTGIRGGNTGGVIVSQGGSLGGSLGGIAGSISSEINNALSNALGAFFAPTTVGSFSSYIQRLYSLKPEDYRGYISVPSAYQTMYSINPVTWKALSGESLAGSFYQNGKLIMGGSSGSGSSRSSSSSSYLGNFGCSSTSGSGASSGVTSGYGIVTSVQPGYIIVKSRNGESVNLRVGSCSRIEANQPNYVVSVSDKLFYKGKQSKPNNFELHDCTVATY